MEKEKISMKGGKYPQDFQEKLMTLSLNADIMSSMVLKSEPPPLISGEQKSNGGLVHPHLKGFDEPKQVSDTRLLEGLLTVLSFTLFSPGHAVRFPKLSARQRLKPMPIGR